mmetsp:Transcript_16030/g.23387  ORF Transcript_16030/g.23387 Transcript_16030/m.23387 type:complete len:97 (+) Transcript_16030:600-890(+)
MDSKRSVSWGFDSNSDSWVPLDSSFPKRKDRMIAAFIPSTPPPSKSGEMISTPPATNKSRAADSILPETINTVKDVLNESDPFGDNCNAAKTTDIP